MTFDLMFLLAAGLGFAGLCLLHHARRGIERELRLRRRLPPVSHHHWHVVAPRPYDWQDEVER